jgi:hypothetical protein
LKISKGVRAQIDISQWLLEGFVERKGFFREHLKNHDWTQYQDQFVAINCSTGCYSSSLGFYIVATIQVAPYAKKIVDGVYRRFRGFSL